MWTFAIRGIIKDLKEISLGMCIVLLGLSLSLILYTLPTLYLIETNVPVIFVYWYAIVPFLTAYISRRYSKRKNILAEALAGMILFYGFAVFLINGQYSENIFQLILYSIAFNTIMVSSIILTKKVRKRFLEALAN